MLTKLSLIWQRATKIGYHDDLDYFIDSDHLHVNDTETGTKVSWFRPNYAEIWLHDQDVELREKGRFSAVDSSGKTRHFVAYIEKYLSSDDLN